jgi:hypothetical protein
MNPKEEPYVAEYYQINATKVYERVKNYISSKSKSESRAARLFLQNLEQAYKGFCEVQKIDDDFNHYNRQRFGLIEFNHPAWFTWFSYQLLILSNPKLNEYLDEYYLKEGKKIEFLVSVSRAVNFIGANKLNFLESRLISITAWIYNKKEGLYNIDNLETNSRFVSDRLTEQQIKAYFNQLTEKGYCSSEDVDILIRGNFNIGENVSARLIACSLPKVHLNYFISSFFKRFYWDDKYHSKKTATFLIKNFIAYQANDKSANSISTLMKNIRKNASNRYPFKEIHQFL